MVFNENAWGTKRWVNPRIERNNESYLSLWHEESRLKMIPREIPRRKKPGPSFQFCPSMCSGKFKTKIRLFNPGKEIKRGNYRIPISRELQRSVPLPHSGYSLRLLHISVDGEIESPWILEGSWKLWNSIVEQPYCSWFNFENTTTRVAFCIKLSQKIVLFISWTKLERKKINFMLCIFIYQNVGLLLLVLLRNGKVDVLDLTIMPSVQQFRACNTARILAIT
jgi:hypothetical protein